MPNKIKYSTTAAPNTLRSGNVLIGMNDVEYGPTSATNFWNGIDPPNGGYCIYNPASNGSNVNIYRPANDTELVKIINEISSNTFTTAEEALAWGAAQTSVVIVNRNYEDIVTDGLVLNLDAGYTVSYPKGGTTWYDLRGTNNGTLTNGPTFNSNNGGSIVFDGSDDYAFVGVTISARQNKSYVSYIKLSNSWSSRGSIFAGARSTTNSFDVDASRRLVGGEDDVFITSPIFMSPNTWYNVAYTFEFDGNTTATQKLYVNGSLSATLTTSNYVDGYITSQTYIGYDSRFFQYFNGEISMLQIYNKTLSAEEIAQNFNAQKSRYGLI